MTDIKTIYKFLKKNTKAKNFTLSKSFFSTLKNPKNKTIIFTDKPIQNFNKLNNFKVLLIVSKKNYKLKPQLKKFSTILSENPKKTFFKILHRFYQKPVLRKKPKIGNNTKIEQNVFIGRGVSIGKNCFIQSNVTISDNVKIGNNTTIKSGAVIGRRGFGILEDKNRNLYEVDHYGGVKIGNFVEIGCVSTIAQGTLENTVISDYNKIDDQVHIAHNCFIGKNNIICTGSVIGGSVTIGNKNFLGMNSTIHQKKKIGSYNTIGASSFVVSNVGNYKTVFGNPAKIFKIK